MKQILVKTIYDNKVGFPEKFYRPLAQVRVGNEIMSLRGQKPVGYSEYLDDKWGREKYRLIYFEWKPQKPKMTKKQKAWEKWNSLSPNQQAKKIQEQIYIIN